jgi:hypothetical protein
MIGLMTELLLVGIRAFEGLIGELGIERMIFTYVRCIEARC